MIRHCPVHERTTDLSTGCECPELHEHKTWDDAERCLLPEVVKAPPPVAEAVKVFPVELNGLLCPYTNDSFHAFTISGDADGYTCSRCLVIVDVRGRILFNPADGTGIWVDKGQIKHEAEGQP